MYHKLITDDVGLNVYAA